MNKTISIFYFLFLLPTVSVVCQSESGFIANLQSGNLQSIDSYLEDPIDFCIYEDQRLLRKSKAIEQLKSFFANNSIKSVEVAHRGKARDNSSQFRVLKVSTTKGDYRMFVYSKGDLSTSKVQEIRIDKY